MKSPSPSLIHINLQLAEKTITGIMAGGKGVLERQREIELN
jgi:hypothetical protein